MAPRETENNAYAEFWGDKQRALWYVMILSGVANWHAQDPQVTRVFFGQIMNAADACYLYQQNAHEQVKDHLI